MPSYTLLAVEAILLRPAEVELAPFLHRALEPLSRQAEAAAVTLRVEIAADVPPRAAIDAPKIAWVVTALVGNALRYVRRGRGGMPGGHIGVRLAHAAPQRMLSITVEDDGPGMEPDVQSRLLAPNVDGDAVGVSLRLVHDVVSAHGRTGTNDIDAIDFIDAFLGDAAHDPLGLPPFLPTLHFEDGSSQLWIQQRSVASARVAAAQTRTKSNYMRNPPRDRPSCRGARTTLWRVSNLHEPMSDRAASRGAEGRHPSCLALSASSIVGPDQGRPGGRAPVTDDFLRFLDSSKKEGRFKVYLGMAAGVGKTMAMLREAKRLRAEGIDVVCGIVETHGRADTLAEISDLEVIPRRTIDYRGVPLQEMDLDAILARRPDLVLVDELAHTNVPGSRHAKRYQDVDELLDAGISVVGALNVQHLESLRDMVLRETGVDVRERVPDRFLHRADELIVVDLAPGDLQERLRAGKIYPPEKVERALAAFFHADKLAALRQLALREVANAVELRERAKVQATRPSDTEPAPEIRGVVDAERVMVSMSSQPSATRRMLRRGARLAGGLNSVWYVVYVRTAGETPERIDSASLRSLADNINLAKELGASVVRLEGADVAEALARFARERNITHAVFGRTRLPAWRERLVGSVLDRFMRLVPEVDVVVVGMPRDGSEGAS